MADFLFESDGVTLRPCDAQVSPFELFGLDALASVDAALLKKAYLGVSRKVHPDRFQRAEADQKENARAWSAKLNEARATLSSPRKTLESLLATKGFDLDPDKVRPPQALLMEVFEINEALDDVEGRKPNESEAKGLIAQREEISQGLAASAAKLSEAGKAFDAGKPEQAFEGWQEVVSRERYLRRILERLEAALKTE